MNERNVLAVKTVTPPKEVGTHFRLTCLTGDDQGVSFYLKNDRVVMGRGGTADIQVKDSKSSREHAELKLYKGTYVLTDLGSHNGIIVNDVKVKQQILKNNDKIIIGKTVYKYSKYEIEDDEEYDEEDEGEYVAPKKSNKKRTMMPVLILLAALMFLLPEEEKKKAPKEKKVTVQKDISDDFTSLLKKQVYEEDKEVREKLNAIIHRGLREYREKNYFRAINEFNLALVLSPNNGRASFYLNKTKQSLDNEIESNFIKARRDTESLKYRAAIVAYCSIMKLLEDYKDDQRYKDASTNLDVIWEKLGLEERENKCS